MFCYFYLDPKFVDIGTLPGDRALPWIYLNTSFVTAQDNSSYHLTISLSKHWLWYHTRQRTTSWTYLSADFALHWPHNDHDGVSNHQPHGCLLNRLFRLWSKKTSKFRVPGLCVGNSPVPHKGPVTRKMFPFDDVIMDNAQDNALLIDQNHFEHRWLWYTSCLHISQLNHPTFSLLLRSLSHNTVKCFSSCSNQRFCFH